MAADRGVDGRLAHTEGIASGTASAAAAVAYAVAPIALLQSLVNGLGAPQRVVPVLGLNALQRKARGGHLELVEIDAVERVVLPQMHDQMIGQIWLANDLERTQALLGDALAHEQYVSQQKAMHVAFADIVFEFVVALHEQVAHLVGGTAAHGSAQIEHLAVLLDELVQHLVVGVLQYDIAILYAHMVVYI